MQCSWDHVNISFIYVLQCNFINYSENCQIHYFSFSSETFSCDIFSLTVSSLFFLFSFLKFSFIRCWVSLLLLFSYFYLFSFLSWKISIFFLDIIIIIIIILHLTVIFLISKLSCAPQEIVLFLASFSHTKDAMSPVISQRAVIICIFWNDVCFLHYYCLDSYRIVYCSIIFKNEALTCSFENGFTV